MTYRRGVGAPGIWLLAVAAFATVAPSQAAQTVGLFLNGEDAYEGYTLFAPLQHETTYLINNGGRLIHSWPSTFHPGLAAYLFENGDLVRAIAGGGVQRIAWDGTSLWYYIYADDDDGRQHHDIEPLPNGNVLMITWEYKPAAEAIAAGRNPDNLRPQFWPLRIVEVEPSGATDGNIVWEWHVWDHLIQDFDPTKLNFGVVGDHPELADINIVGGNRDWLHTNSIDYNHALDQIVVSLAHAGEIWVIDHSTTTAEAAGHTGGNSGKGGDLLYRWGNPANYDRGLAADRRLFSQHDARWIEPGLVGAGNIMFFNNGGGRPEGQFSTVDEIAPPVDANGDYTLAAGSAFGPSELAWSYVPDPQFYANIMSGAHRLPNGNTLVVKSPDAELFEIDPDDEIVWKYVCPVGAQGPVRQGETGTNVFRAHRYAPDHPAFEGRELTPGNPIEDFDAPPPVADGTNGTSPMTCARVGEAGDRIDCTWASTTCPSFNHNLIYGNLTDVASYSTLGAECTIGPVGAYQWNGVPAGDLFFLIVGTEPFGVYESSWGTDSAGAQRNGTVASNLCGITTKDVTASCP